ncbi:MAG: class I SAM-dependent methyltransferase [Burkholderiales bacterium]|nr:class I SAM-dependent methyltransferase [Burkholderiales bacterium]
MPSRDEMQSYYAARAPYYDDVYDKPERREDIAFLKSHLPAVFAGRKVLEIACGTGYWTQHIAPAAAAMTATDAVAQPLDLARGRPGVGAVRFALADAYDLPESLGTFDAAFAGLWLSHVPVERRNEFLSSLHRHLAPGAKVVLIDNSEVQLKDFPIAERDAHGNTWQMRRLKDGTMHRVLKNFPSRAELEAMIAGFGVRPAYQDLQNFWLLEYEAA